MALCNEEGCNYQKAPYMGPGLDETTKKETDSGPTIKLAGYSLPIKYIQYAIYEALKKEFGDQVEFQFETKIEYNNKKKKYEKKKACGGMRLFL